MLKLSLTAKLHAPRPPQQVVVKVDREGGEETRIVANLASQSGTEFTLPSPCLAAIRACTICSVQLKADCQPVLCSVAADAGFMSWVAWRSAYLTRLGSIRARIQVAFDWTITLL